MLSIWLIFCSSVCGSVLNDVLPLWCLTWFRTSPESSWTYFPLSRGLETLRLSLVELRTWMKGQGWIKEGNVRVSLGSDLKGTYDGHTPLFPCVSPSLPFSTRLKLVSLSWETLVLSRSSRTSTDSRCWTLSMEVHLCQNEQCRLLCTVHLSVSFICVVHVSALDVLRHIISF